MLSAPTAHKPRKPSRGILRYSFAAAIGIVLGMGMFTFHYAEGWSYFSSDPKACMNCHIMQPQFESWQKSSHHAVAVCNDCHLPDSLVPKLMAKSNNGWRHSWAFTFQDFHEPIQITQRNADILQENCLRCHEDTVHQMLTVQSEPGAIQCVHCHADVGHAAR